MKKPVIDFDEPPLKLSWPMFECTDEETLKKEIDALLMKQSFNYEWMPSPEESKKEMNDLFDISSKIN